MLDLTEKHLKKDIYLQKKTVNIDYVRLVK